MTEYRVIVIIDGPRWVGRTKCASQFPQPSRGVSLEFQVVSKPDILKEGAAISDFTKPDRVIVGSDNPRTAESLKILYDAFTCKAFAVPVSTISRCRWYWA
jgi:UDPglucose 6-dehydrogenase